MASVCLNMIVKNESANIVRFLNAVVPFIDCYCICDTGSTDSTIKIIQDFFQDRSIVGTVIYEPFVNFGHTRTYSFTRAKELFPEADYYLFMDADMVFRSNLSPVDFRQQLLLQKGDIYMVFQGSDNYSTKNSRLCRGGSIAAQSHYIGVTHEYFNFPTGNVVTLNPSVFFILDIGDGGCKADKFKRDIRLLEEDLFRDPYNGRTLFYLGNSYKDDGQDEKAIEIYKRKIESYETRGHQWFEEIWHSYYNMGVSYRNLKKPHDAISYWMQAFQIHPKRVENLYEIIKEYRIQNKPALAYEIYVWASRIAKNSLEDNIDFLFTQRDVYNWKLDYELSIVGYYYNPMKYSMSMTCMNLLAKPVVRKFSEYWNILSNYKHYVETVPKGERETTVLSKLKNFEFPKTLVAREQDVGQFVSSTPSLILHQGQLWVNVRYVNYAIDEKGGYVNHNAIITRNVLYNIFTGKSTEWEVAPVPDTHYKGIEDVRLFSKDGVLYYNGNRGTPHQKFQVEHGMIDLINGQGRGVVMNSPYDQNTEKNWVLFNTLDSPKKLMVYKWFPLTIGEMEKCVFQVKHVQQEGLPALFNDVRGSTNGVNIADEIWFVCHVVSHEDRRFYYHLFVVLDGKTMQFKRYSKMYKLVASGNQVEYVLGMVACKDDNDELQLILGCSVLDRTTEFISVDVKKLVWL